MPYIEDFHEFSQRMRCRKVFAAGWYYYENGAKSDGRDAHAGPSDNDFERLSNQKKYHVTRAKFLANAFERMRKALMGGGFFDWIEKDFGPRPRNGVEGLKYLKSQVETHRTAIAKIDDELGGTDEGLQDFYNRRAQRWREEEAQRLEIKAAKAAEITLESINYQEKL